jgi:hypothetical protein
LPLGFRFGECGDAEICLILDGPQEQADKETPDMAKVKSALGRLRLMLIGVESKTAYVALERIGKLARRTKR